MNSTLKLESAYVLVRASGAIAIHCDRSEHNEDVLKADLQRQGRLLRELASELAAENDLDLIELYASRLEGLEGRHPMGGSGLFDGPGEARKIESWADAQQVQYKHDLWYHPDVVGMSKFSQIRHYAFHVSKLATLTLDAALAVGETAERLHADFWRLRLADIFIFGIKLSTVTGERLGPVMVNEHANLTSGDPSVTGELLLR